MENAPGVVEPSLSVAASSGPKQTVALAGQARQPTQQWHLLTVQYSMSMTVVLYSF
jgi:hypothetical protein